MYIVKNRFGEGIYGYVKTMAEAEGIVKELEDEDNKHDAYEPDSYLIIKEPNFVITRRRVSKVYYGYNPNRPYYMPNCGDSLYSLYAEVIAQFDTQDEVLEYIKTERLRGNPMQPRVILDASNDNVLAFDVKLMHLEEYWVERDNNAIPLYRWEWDKGEGKIINIAHSCFVLGE